MDAVNTTTLERADAAGARERRGTAAPIERWTDRRVVVAGLVVAAVRFWFAVDRRVFHVVADEPGQLAMARWLSGGTRWNMFDHSTWRPGYSLVLAPVFWLVDTGEGAVRAALTTNAVLAGISAMILTRLVWRWTSTWTTPEGSRAIGGATCAAISVAVALAPAAIAASAYTWAEAMITATFLVTVWWTQRLVDSGRTVDAIGAAVSAAVAITTHGRSLTLLPMAILIGVVVLVTRRHRLGAAAVVAVGATLGLASVAFTRWVHDAVWDDPSEINGTGSVIERLDAPTALLESFVGQTWYQLVASLGMVGVGAGVLLVSLVRPVGRLDRGSATVLAALTAPLMFTSVTFMADRERADQLVYGRYVDAVVWPLVAIGLAVVVRAFLDPNTLGDRRPGHRLVLSVAATCALFGLLVAWRHGDQLAGDVGLRMMVPGLLPYIGADDGVPVLTITVLAAGATAAIALLFRRARSFGRGATIVAGLAVAVAVGWSGVRVHDAQATALNTWAIDDAVARLDELVPAGERIGVVFVHDSDDPRVPYAQQRQRYQIYQLYLPDRELVWERTPARPSTRFLLAPAGHPPLVDLGATVRWGDPAVRVALWELPVPGVPSPG